MVKTLVRLHATRDSIHEQGKPTDLSWSAGKVVVDGEAYAPIAFHREDAERVVNILMPDAVKWGDSNGQD